ncbi:putative cucumisin [Helianthus debilis subsp. tardiflorus]
MINLLFGVILLGSSYYVSAEKQTYIVHMSHHHIPPSFNQDHTHWFDSSLKSVSPSAEMIYTYQNVIHGFSTRLTAQEAESLETLPGIISVLPELKYELHTTRTPEFLGLDQKSNLFPQSDGESDVVIGVLDTGVWPESKSFDDTDDYFDFLCALNYTPAQIQVVTKRNTTCDTTKSYSISNLNYPSFAVVVSSDSTGKTGGSTVVKHTRTLTNVGPASTYKVTTFSDSKGVQMSVVPNTLTFSKVNEKQSYTVTFTVGDMAAGSNAFGRIEWSDGKYVVGSPVAVSW